MPTRNFRRLEADLRQLVVDAVRKRTPFDQLRAAIEEVLAPYYQVARPDQVPAIRSALNAASQQYDWMRSRQIDADDRTAVATVLRRAGSDVARMGGRTNRRVLEAVESGLSRGVTATEIENQVAHHIRGFKAVASTIVNTATGGFDRINTFHVAREAGIQRFKYDGPPGERAFCREQMALAAAGKTYTREEMAQLSNGQGLSVDLYCGGFNCRHQWIVVVDQPHGPPPEKVEDASTKPVGTAVGSALKIPKSAQMRPVRDAAAIIDAIHGDGNLKSMPVKRNQSRRTNGEYRYYRGVADGNVEITISAHGDHPMTTFAHEVGHFLDHQGFGKKGTYSSISDPAFQRWRDAVLASRAYKRFAELRSLGHIEVTTESGMKMKWSVSTKALDYYESWEETWARSYAQYIAMKSGNETMLNELVTDRAKRDPYAQARQWDADDFDPIFQAIEDLLKQQGWMQ